MFCVLFSLFPISSAKDVNSVVETQNFCKAISRLSLLTPSVYSTWLWCMLRFTEFDCVDLLAMSNYKLHRYSNSCHKVMTEGSQVAHYDRFTFYTFTLRSSATTSGWATILCRFPPLPTIESVGPFLDFTS